MKKESEKNVLYAVIWYNICDQDIIAFTEIL